VKRAAKLLIVLALVALLPLRALASVTIGFCAFSQAEAAVAAQAAHDHASEAHGAASGIGADADCNACAEHCAGASVLLPAAPGVLAGAFGAERATLVPPFAAGHVPDHLDPPPLAL